MTIENTPIPPLIEVNELPPIEPSKPKMEKKKSKGVKVKALTSLDFGSFQMSKRLDNNIKTLPPSIARETIEKMEKAGQLIIL